MLKSIDERIVELTRSVLDAAQADAEKIQGEAKHKEAEILKRGDLQAKQVYAEILVKARTVSIGILLSFNVSSQLPIEV